MMVLGAVAALRIRSGEEPDFGYPPAPTAEVNFIYLREPTVGVI